MAAILDRHFGVPAEARAWLDERLRSTGTAARANYAEALAGEEAVKAMARLCRTAERVDARVARALMWNGLSRAPQNFLLRAFRAR